MDTNAEARVPTAEQSEAVETFMEGANMKINAFAGSGKTSTLEMLANERAVPGTYLCFNKPIAEAAKLRFPPNIDCRTTHSFAYRQVIHLFRSNSARMGGNLRAYDTLRFLKLRDFPIFGGSERLGDSTLGYAVNETVKRFIRSADPEVANQHFAVLPKFTTLPQEEFYALRTRVVGWARQLWEDMSSPNGTMPVTHDGYVKVWQLGTPVIDSCFILVDEAQDTNPVMLDVLAKQECQIVYVGDKHQQIYEWRGAINAMETVNVKKTVNLTKSFRFGQTIADFASEILSTIGERVRIQGNERIKSEMSRLSQPAILCRTNGQILDTLISLEESDQNKRAFVQGGVDDLVKCLDGIERLQDKQTSAYAMFLGFKDWDEFVLYSKASGDNEAEKIVKLCDKYGTTNLKAALLNVRPTESGADVLLSTAHKAKGREWKGVHLADDFKAQPETDPETKEKIYNPAESRLFYVAATRAIEQLNVPEWARELYYKEAE